MLRYVLPLQKHFAITVPDCCPQCMAARTVRLEQVIHGTAVYLSWVCSECDAEWNIDAGEPQFIERRLGARDRRSKRRADRRKKSN